MSRWASVTVDVEVSIGQFEDDDILVAAAEIIRNHQQTKEPEPGSYNHDYWQKIDHAVGQVATVVGLAPNHGPDDTSLPPASTAARITSMDALRAFIADQAKH